MADDDSIRRRKKAPRPLDAARLEELALAYVARFAVSQAKLEGYLKRKLRERGWEGEREPQLQPLVERYVALGYVDDEAFARAKTAGLLRRGYGMRRVQQALGAAGIAPEIRDDLEIGEAQERASALALARKRRFGPFGADLPDRDLRQKQIAALLRAGHALDSALELVNAQSVEAAEHWATAANDEEVSR